MNLMTIPELARMLGVTRVRAWQMLKENKFKAVKFSHCWAVTEAAAKKILKEKELKKIKEKEKNHENSDSVPAF